MLLLLVLFWFCCCFRFLLTYLKAFWFEICVTCGCYIHVLFLLLLLRSRVLLLDWCCQCLRFSKFVVFVFVCVCIYMRVLWVGKGGECVCTCVYACVLFCLLVHSFSVSGIVILNYHSQSFAFQHAHIYTHEHYVTASGVPNHTSRVWDNNRVIFSPQPIVLACRKRATTAIDDDRGQHSPIVGNRLTTKTDEGTSFGWLHARHIPLLQPV